MDILELPPMTQYTVTCHTPECENHDITIHIDAPVDNPYVLCGVCGAQLDPTLESEMDLEPE